MLPQKREGTRLPDPPTGDPDIGPDPVPRVPGHTGRVNPAPDRDSHTRPTNLALGK